MAKTFGGPWAWRSRALVRAGTLRRVGRGLYDVPRTHPLLGNLAPSVDTRRRVAHLRGLLPARQKARLLKDLPLAPAWMHPFLRYIAGQD